MQKQEIVELKDGHGKTYFRIENSFWIGAFKLFSWWESIPYYDGTQTLEWRTKDRAEEYMKKQEYNRLASERNRV